MVRDGARGMGLELLADEGVESDTVTAIKLPTGIDGNKVMQVARDDFQTVFAGGQGSLRGKIIRFGHLGFMTEDDITSGLDALKKTLDKVGFKK